MSAVLELGLARDHQVASGVALLPVTTVSLNQGSERLDHGGDQHPEHHPRQPSFTAATSETLVRRPARVLGKHAHGSIERAHAFNFQAGALDEVDESVARPALVVMGCAMQGEALRSDEQQHPARAQHARDFGKRAGWLGEMLQHLHAQDCGHSPVPDRQGVRIACHVRAETGVGRDAGLMVNADIAPSGTRYDALKQSETAADVQQRSIGQFVRGRRNGTLNATRGQPDWREVGTQGPMPQLVGEPHGPSLASTIDTVLAADG